MVDMTDSKSVAGDCVRVQVSSPVRFLRLSGSLEGLFIFKIHLSFRLSPLAWLAPSLTNDEPKTMLGALFFNGSSILG